MGQWLVHVLVDTQSEEDDNDDDDYDVQQKRRIKRKNEVMAMVYLSKKEEEKLSDGNGLPVQEHWRVVVRHEIPVTRTNLG